MLKSVLLVVFFGTANSQTVVNFQFETIEQCELAYTKLKEKYGTDEHSFIASSGVINSERSGCIE